MPADLPHALPALPPPHAACPPDLADRVLALTLPSLPAPLVATGWVGLDDALACATDGEALRPLVAQVQAVASPSLDARLSLALGGCSGVAAGVPATLMPQVAALVDSLSRRLDAALPAALPPADAAALAARVLASTLPLWSDAAAVQPAGKLHPWRSAAPRAGVLMAVFWRGMTAAAVLALGLGLALASWPERLVSPSAMVAGEPLTSERGTQLPARLLVEAELAQVEFALLAGMDDDQVATGWIADQDLLDEIQALRDDMVWAG